MKFKFALLMAMALFTTKSFAQGSSPSEMAQDGTISSKGFRIGIVKPILELDLKVSLGGASASDYTKVNDALGFSLGYASLPVQALGWTVNFAYMDLNTKESSADMVRVDGNLAYAFTDILSIKGGLNISKLTGKDSADDLNAGIGLQGSLGVQITRNFGIDIGYIQMNQSGTMLGTDVDLKESGLELGLHGTF